MGYNHSDIGHNWAHQLKPRQGDRYYSFNGRKIKSYSTVIGEIVYTKNNTPVYFLNTGSYSNSTCKHQNYAFGAIPKYAVKFSASCGEFMYGWDGITNWNGEITETIAKNFVMKNLQSIYDSLLAFRASKALKIEKEFSLKYFYKAMSFMEYFPLTSFSKVLRIKNENLKMFFHISNPTLFRKVVKALIAGEKDLKALVDIACGDGTYGAYYKRTMGIRMSETTRKYNHKCGFETVGIMDMWYNPYPYCYGKKDGSRWPKNMTFISHSFDRYCGKGFTSKQILQHLENGDLISVLFEARKKNLANAFLYEEKRLRSKRVEEAKERLEIFIGLRGWQSDWRHKYKHTFSSFNYNGVEYSFNRWNEEKELSDDEYKAFGSMSAEEQNEFVRTKRTEMLEVLRQQDYNYKHRAELAEKAHLEWEKEQAAKREYIERLKAQGDEGIRQLWHEGLIGNTSLWNKPMTVFYGGNVLLRVADNGENVVTSKGITIPLKECKRLWLIINRWHNDKTEFCSSNETVRANRLQRWNIQRYQNDIMIAGCHAIAYKEMATIAKQLNFC